MRLRCALSILALGIGSALAGKQVRTVEQVDEAVAAIKAVKDKDLTRLDVAITEAIEKAHHDWLSDPLKQCSRCECYQPQIDKDLKLWEDRGGIKLEEFEKARDVVRSTYYQIRSHRLYRSNDCMFPARCQGVEHFILEIIADLPDMDFIVNVRDWPQSSVRRNTPPIPIYSFSKQPTMHNDIMYPAWTFWEGGPAVWPLYPRGLGRWDQMKRDLKKKAKEWPWDKKIDKFFFRGSRTSDERDPLVLLSRARPDIGDASYTKNQAYKGPLDTLFAEPAAEIHLVDHCKYKYLFNFRGVAASFRHKHLFVCNSLVFHVGQNDTDNDWLEFYYSAMKPWIHYIPVEPSMGNVNELMHYFKLHQDLAQTIAQRGYDFVNKNLRMDEIRCYWKRSLLKYRELLKFDLPAKNPDFKEIRRKYHGNDEL